MTIRVNWFTPVSHRDYNRMAASLWIRCYQLLPYLAERGVKCTVNDPEAQADVSVFVRWQDSAAHRMAIHQKGRGHLIIFDLVVNYFDEAKTRHLGRTVTRRHIDQAKRMLSVADAVTCSSAFIAQRARRFHNCAEYLPDSIDRRHFSRTKAVCDFHRPRLRAIWSGVSVKARELEPLVPLLLERDVGLTVISDKRPRLRVPGRPWGRRIPLRFVPWRYETFPSHILEGEICCVYRPVDDPYNQGHSLFKIGVFVGQGVPAIASPVPSYLELLANADSGLVCSTIDEWAETLDMIIEDRGILSAWSHQARRAIEPYTTAALADRYVALFERLCGKDHVACDEEP